MIEEADAWFEYLEATRGQTALRYREVEPWAWARLRQRLRAVRHEAHEAPPRSRRLGESGNAGSRCYPVVTAMPMSLTNTAARAPPVIGRP